MKYKRRIISILMIFIYINMFLIPTNIVNASEKIEGDVSKAINWLVSKQKDNGSWENSLQKICDYNVLNILQNKSEYIDNYEKGINYYKDIKEINNDYMARRYLIKDLVSSDELDKLVESQNEDGGFGILKNYSSDVLDTCLILNALLENYDDKYKSVVTNGIVFLMNKQNDDGSYSIFDCEGDIELTSRVISTLELFINKTKIVYPELNNVIDLASEYVRNNIEAVLSDKENLSKVNTFIIGYKALIDSNKEPEDLKETLIKLQRNNGSILDNEYSTSLYIQTLELIEEKDELKDNAKDLTDIKLNKVTENNKLLEQYTFDYDDKLAIEMIGEYDSSKLEIVGVVEKQDKSCSWLTFDTELNMLTWNVDNQLAGEYKAIVWVKDKESGSILKTFEKNFIINEYIKIESASLLLNNKKILVKQDGKIVCTPIINYRSNIDKQLDYDIYIKNENGEVVFNQNKNTIFDSDSEYIQLDKITYTLNTDKECKYEINILIKNGDEKLYEYEKEIAIYSPEQGSNIEIKQNLSKSKLYPGKDDTSIKFNIMANGIKQEKKDVNIIFAVDCSYSDKKEVNNTAKKVVEKFEEYDYKGGVVLFGSNSYVKQKLTEDKTLIKDAINKYDEVCGSSRYDSAISSAITELTNEGQENSEKVIVLISDGYSNMTIVNNSIKKVVENAKVAGIKIYTIGVRGDDSNISIPAGEKDLTAISKATGGKYIDSSDIEKDFDELISSMYLKDDNNVGKNVMLETTVGDKLQIDEEKINYKEYKIKNNDDGTNTITWNIDNLVVNDNVDIELPIYSDNLISDSRIELIKDTKLTYYDKNNNRVEIMLDNLSINVEKYSISTEIQTDNKEYSSNEEVKININTQNMKNYDCKLERVTGIYDNEGKLVEILEDNVTDKWQGQEARTNSIVWNTKNYMSGKYTIKIVWYEEEKQISCATKDFYIVNDGEVNNTISVDKISYNENEDVLIYEKIKNTSTNTIEKDLNVKTKIIGPDSSEYIISEEKVDDLMFGNIIERNLVWNTKEFAPGEYTVISTIYNETKEISNNKKTFKIVKTENDVSLIKGNIDIANTELKQGDNINFTCKVDNIGDIEIKNIELKVSIIRIESEEVKKEKIIDKVDLIKNSSATRNCYIDMQEIECGRYMLVYEAIINTQSVLLDKVVFTINPFIDKFEKDSSSWNILGDAYISEQGYLVLTENKQWQSGAAWIKEDISGPFTVKFKYKMGNGTQSSGDGFAFMFYKKPNELGGNGRELGFKEGNGYAVEFDSFYDEYYGENTSIDGENISYGKKHIALSKDIISTGNKGQVIDSLALNCNDEIIDKFDDNKWHNVEIRVIDNRVNVYVDGNKVISYKSDKELDNEYSGVGFSAATGDSTENHFIDDVEIYKYYDDKFDYNRITDVNSTQIVGSNINLINNIYGGVGNSYYKFDIYNENGIKVYTNDYSLINNIQWIPTKTGKYKIEYSIKDNNGVVITENKYLDIKDILKINNVQVNEEKNAFVENTMKIGVASEGGIGKYIYNFIITKNNNVVYESGYIDESELNFIPSEEGYYEIKCQVKDSMENIAEKVVGVTVYSKESILVHDINSNVKEYGFIDNPIQFNINAESGEKLKYRFVIQKDGVSVYTRGYKENNSTTWIPSEAGSYTIHFKIKNESGTLEHITKEIYICNKGEIILKEWNIDKKSPQKIGTPIVFSMNAVSDETLEYRFVVQEEGKYVYTRGYEESNVATWVPSKAGTYTIHFKVKNKSGTVEHKKIQYVIED